MATIRKKKNGKKLFTVDYRLPGGVRKRVCFTTRSEANKFRITVEERILKAKEGLLPDEYVQTQGGDITVNDLYGIYHENKIELKKKKSAQDSAKSNIVSFVRRFEKRKASTLTPKDIDDYHVEWIKAGNAETSFQMSAKNFIGMLRWGKKHKHIGSNPLEGYGFENGAKAKQKEALTKDEIKKFKIGLEESEPRLIPFLIFGVNTGMRIREMLTLEWDQVDIEKKEVYIPEEKSKTNTARKIPLNDDCIAVIEELKKTRPDAPYVFWHLHDYNFITPLIKKFSKRYLDKEHTPHYWRVTFATRALKGRQILGVDGKMHRESADLKTVAEVGGWAPNSLVLMGIYQMVDEELKRHCVEMVDFGLTIRKKEVGSFGQQSAEMYAS